MLAPSLSLYKKFILEVQNDVTINVSLHNFLAVFSQNLLAVQTRLNVFSGNINDQFLIKQLHNNLSLFGNATSNYLFKSFQPSKHPSPFLSQASNLLYDVIICLARSTLSFANRHHNMTIILRIEHFHKISLLKN